VFTARYGQSLCTSLKLDLVCEGLVIHKRENSTVEDWPSAQNSLFLAKIAVASDPLTF
jgi:hypothetical protein